MIRFEITRPVRLVCLLMTMTLFGSVDSAFSQPKSVGPVISYHKVPGGIAGRTASSIFDIRAYATNAMRVRISQEKSFRDFSYMIDGSLKPSDVEVRDSAGLIILKTEKFTAEIERKPELRLTFKDLDGSIINEDEEGKGFGTSFFGKRVTTYKKLQEGERFVGLGEVLGNLDRRGSVYNLQNVDTFNYGDQRLPMYTNVPFYIGILNDKCYGLFYHNSYQGTFNFGAGNTRFLSIEHEGGDADYFFFYDDSPAKIIEAYTAVTGKSPLPPLWSLGFHQSRCSYYNEGQVMGIANTFRSKGIPLDCIVLDADYLVDYHPFEINASRFPDLKGMSKKLESLGIRLTASVNPGIAIDSSYAPALSALAENVILRYQDGTPYIAPIAPNVNYYIDYTKPEGRNWWHMEMKMMADNGIKGYWNDMNEPAVSESVVPDNVAFDFDGQGSSALEAKNLFGMLMARSSYEAGIENGGGERPFVLTRSGFAGVQRYAAVWSGDNTANAKHLLLGGLLNCQMGISGIPFTGADIGGFIGDGSKELYTRWIEVGMFAAFARSHRIAFGAANEPWSYGEIAEGIAKTYISLRYRMLPYIYSSFYETTQTGIPLTRSLCIYYPHDSNAFGERYQYEYLFGPSILVVPALPDEKQTPVYLPAGEWHDIYTGKILEGSREFSTCYPDCELPLFVKGSSIIVMQNQIQSTSEIPSDTLCVHLFKGSQNSSFTYYEDDGLTFAYKDEGGRLIRNIYFNAADKTLTFSAQTGTFKSRFKVLRIILHGFGDVQAITVDGRPASVFSVDSRLFDPLENLAGYYEKDQLESARKAIHQIIEPAVDISNKSSLISLGIN